MGEEWSEYIGIIYHPHFLVTRMVGDDDHDESWLLEVSFCKDFVTIKEKN